MQELYEQRGMAHGYDIDDWLQAERMVIEKKTKKTTNQREKEIKNETHMP